MSGRQNSMGGTQVSSNRAGEKYCAEGIDREESEDESAEWSEEDMEGLATEEEDETAGGKGGSARF